MINILVKIKAFNVYYVGSTKILEFQASSSSKMCSENQLAHQLTNILYTGAYLLLEF